MNKDPPDVTRVAVGGLRSGGGEQKQGEHQGATSVTPVRGSGGLDMGWKSMEVVRS